MLFIVPLLLPLLAAASAALPATAVGRIVGGQDAYQRQFPIMASLRLDNDEYTDTHVCGATIVNARWLLTAAHCLQLEPSVFSIVVAAHRIRGDGRRHAIRRFVLHEQYDPERLDADVALVELVDAIDLTPDTGIGGPDVMPVHLSQDIVGVNEAVTIVGWGNLSYGSQAADVLQYLTMTTLSNVDCSARMPSDSRAVRADEICLFNDRSSGSCDGDSGGPALLNGEQIGIASWTVPPCVESGAPAVYVRIEPYIDWILNRTALEYK